MLLRGYVGNLWIRVRLSGGRRRYAADPLIYRSPSERASAVEIPWPPETSSQERIRVHSIPVG